MSFGSIDRSRAIVIGTLLTFVGLSLLALTAHGESDARAFALGGLLSVGGVLRLMTAFSMDARRAHAHPVDRSDPRWHGGAGLVQLAGRPCVDCGRKITVAGEALACPLCARPTHLDCEEPHRRRAHRPAPDGPFR